ncbi:calpain-5 isoform X1 [Octopus bimaculoides]|nr:calpain-5 isoform X1 [Octopus bimaculoides]|eukprot:XP_014773741.1 PREDICTED: calpain-5-like isoform X1 [Octopus bimaculoides]
MEGAFSEMPKLIPFAEQKFHKLRNECRKKSILFTDPKFPANNSAIFFSRSPPSGIIWKRPGDIAEDPKFFLDSASAEDFAQGSLGNCWFVAACASVAEHPDLWKKVVPDYEEQEWSPKNKYAGIFHFKFWQMGDWVDVVVDDLLPTINGKLIFAHSTSKNEFWSALLEKAYAKLFGSYEALTGGKSRDAMVDMTGGVGESVRLSEYRSQEKKAELFKSLLYAYENKALMSASIMAVTQREREAENEEGLVKGHAYSITAVKKLMIGTSLLAYFKREKVYMVRCRNPWGGVEWKGAWSDGSPEWQNVSESTKKELGLTLDHNDGEFWMAFDDFCQFYTDIDICHIVNTKRLTFKMSWKEFKYKGEWKPPNRWGGCGNNENFLDNPQYLFRIHNTQELLLSLEQSEKRSSKKKGKENDVIGFTVFRAGINQKYRIHNKLYDRIHSGPFSNARGVFARVAFKKGVYCVIPSTFESKIRGEFILRIYATSNINLRELIKEGPKAKRFFRAPYLAATAVNIFRGEQLFSDTSQHKVYCIIRCEKKKQKIPSFKGIEEFNWNTRATFFRQKPEEDVKVEVWEKRFFGDKCLGYVTLPMARANWSKYQSMNTSTRYVVQSKDEKSADYDRNPQYLWIIVQQSEALHTL